MKFILAGVVLTVAIVGLSVAVDMPSRGPRWNGLARTRRPVRSARPGGSKAQRPKSNCGLSLPDGLAKIAVLKEGQLEIQSR